MSNTTIYFLFTDTGTTLSKLINFFTRQTLNHVSISLDEELTDVYSFGRKCPNNPFIGGFVREDVKGEFLRDSNSAVYTFKITKNESEIILNNIKKIEGNQNQYKYNFIGLIGVLFHIEINREYAYFCSQFVSRVMSDIDSFHINKPHCFVTPTDIRNHEGMQLIYEGKLSGYRCGEINVEHKLLKPTKLEQTKSFVFMVSEKVKKLVVR